MSEQWLKEAADALEILVGLPPENRSTFINENGKIWSDLKSALSKISHEKCWYSEARIAPSELEIDHFRPKNRVSKSKLPHKGYWWLSFQWTNFRLAYSLVNKRRRDPRDENIQGKGCYFPLIDEDARVTDAKPAPTDRERPQLIDPCVKADVGLLDYAVEDGKVVERFTLVQDMERHERAKVSIDLFHLNEGTLIRDRHELQVAIRHAANRIEDLETLRESAGPLSKKDQEEYDLFINQIGDLINSASRFSSFARACVRQGGDRGWNTELLITA